MNLETRIVNVLRDFGPHTVSDLARMCSVANYEHARFALKLLQTEGKVTPTGKVRTRGRPHIVWSLA